jgi:hypothetical protein
LVNKRIWVDGTPSTTVEPVANAAQYIVTEDIIQTVSVAACQGGSIDYYCAWYPLSSNSTLVAV